MRVFEWPEFTAGKVLNFIAGKKTALTIGAFDGIHRGHQVLLRAILQKAPGLVPLVITFRKNPKEFFKKEQWEGDILSLNQKLEIFRQEGLPALVLIDFSVQFSKIAGRDFLAFLQHRGNPGYVALGSNFHCGYGMDAGPSEIRSFFHETAVEIFESRMSGGSRISSSRIRGAIRSGDIQGAAELLGRPVAIDMPPPVMREGKNLLFRVSGRITPPPGIWPVQIRRGGLPPEHGEMEIRPGGEAALCGKDEEFQAEENLRIEFECGASPGPDASGAGSNCVP